MVIKLNYCLQTITKSDFSEYPENSKLYDKTNKKVIDKMKDETKSLLN